MIIRLRPGVTTLFILMVGCLRTDYVSAGDWAVEKSREQIDIFYQGKHLAGYRYPSDWKFPYIYPVKGLTSGMSLTLEKGILHPHHRSLYLACDRINDCNFWQDNLEAGIIRSTSPVSTITPNGVIITDTCEWSCRGNPPLIRDNRKMLFSIYSPTIWLIECQFSFEFLTNVTILPSNHSLFSIEVIHELSVAMGGKIENAQGGLNESGTFGIPSPWCSYYGYINGVTEGITLVQHPSNRGYPWNYFSRDYGFLSPTPMNWLPKEGVRYLPGQNERIKFLVIIHAGDPQTAAVNLIAEKWQRGELE